MGPAELLVKNHLNFEKFTQKSLSDAKIGFFCSPIGLGHATRDVAVARLLDKFKVTFVSGNAAARLISECGFSVRDLYRPPRFDVRNGALQNSSRWLWQYYKYYKECKKIAERIIEDQKPEIIISDEDFASLSVAHRRKIPTILITDILQTRFTGGLASIIEKRMNSSMSRIMQRCDAVIMPESGKDEGNIRRVGPIVRGTESTRDELRKKFSFTRKTVTVSVGGTDAGTFLIQKAMNATKNMDVDTVLVSGPSLCTEYPNIRNMGFVNNLHEIIYASDLVISLAGKSTIDEARAYGTPGIFIPIKNHFEQEDNAESEGYTYGDVFRLESLIAEKIRQPRSPAFTDGARRACGIILQHVSPNT